MTDGLAGQVPDADAEGPGLEGDLDRALSSAPRPRVLIAVHAGAGAVQPEAVRNAYPEAEVDVVDLADPGWRSTATGGPLDVVVDGSRDPTARVDLFDRTFPRLGHRRLYLAASLRGPGDGDEVRVKDPLWSRLVELLDAPAAVAEPDTAAGVSRADLRRIELPRGHLLVERNDHGPTTSLAGAGVGLGAVLGLVGDVDAPVVGVFGGRRAARIAERLGQRWPQARVHRLKGRMRLQRLHATLAAYGRFDLLLDATGGGESSRVLFRTGFLHLRPGGHLVVLDHPVAALGRDAVPDTAFWPYVVRLTHVRGQGRVPLRDARTADANLADSLRRIEVGPRHLVLTNETAALAVLRDEAANAVAALRDDRSIRLLEHREPLRFDSRAALGENDDARDPVREPASFAVPALSVREYRDVVCEPGQVAVLGNLVLPETYRHGRYRRLMNRRLTRITRWFVDDVPVPPTRLEGSYYYLDGELRHHFGHVTSEQLSRLWAWPAAKAADPSLRLLVSRAADRDGPTEWELQLFEAAGVPRADVVCIASPVVVERLIGVTPMYSMPSYVHPDIAETWDRIGDELERRSTMPPAAARVFITRAPGSNRWCYETPQVERLFRDRGFTVVRPELLELPDQIALVRAADVVAGFAGSGMFNLMFASTPKRVVLIRSSSYIATNEYLIASVRGHRLETIECRADIARVHSAPRIRASSDADGDLVLPGRSSFHFDLDRDRRRLEELVPPLQDEERDPSGG
jgi:capsular polysaccharide biosynthesis protein